MDDIEITVRLSGKNKEDALEILEEGAKEIVRNIKKTIPEMGIRLKTNKLLNAVKYKRTENDSVSVYVDEKEAPHFKYLEEGYSSFSMKNGFLNGKNAKISKKGYKYARVPIGNNKIVTVSGDPESSASWIHPGYVGRYPFYTGVEKSKYSVIKTVQKLIDLLPLSREMTPRDVEDWT